MLVLEDRYRPGFPKFLAAILSGAETEDAFQKVYGRDLDAVEKDLEAYFHGGPLNWALFPTQLRKVEVERPGPADPVLVELHLARVLAAIDRDREAAARLEKLTAANPSSWEVQEARAQAAWRGGKLEDARDAMRKAVDLKPPAWNIYYDYARLAAGDDSHSAAVLDALLEVRRLNPAHLEARIMMGEQLYRMKQYREAVEHYKTIKQVTPALAARMFLGMAWAQVAAQQFDEARMTGLSALKYAREERDRKMAGQLLDYLKQRRDRASAAMPVPVLTGGPVAEARQERQRLSLVRGDLKLVECKVNSAKLTVIAEDKVFELLIADPDAITIRNQPGSSVNLTCGPQKNVVKVAIEFVDKPDEAAGTAGEVRTVEFLQ